jgi:carboxyl-terminal processing protease
MLTGSGADGQVFEQLRFNANRPADTAASTITYSGQVQYGESSFPAGTALPRLGLSRVYVLATGGTCSASESIINGLRGVGVDVVIIGETTCGKPYGFSRKDNCGVSYFPIEFQGVNAQGFGDYAAGFSPTCALADDFDHALGDSTERLLAAALHHIDNGSCPSQPLSARAGPSQSSSPARTLLRGKLIGSPGR